MIATYSKIADSVVDSGLSPYAGWLYAVIVRHMNRKTNELRKTVKELAMLAQMSARSVIRYTKVLEAKNLLRVQRSQTSEVADVNLYSLAGATAAISLFNGVPDSHITSDSESQQPAERRVPQSHCKDSINDNTPNDGVCVPDWAIQEIRNCHGLNPDWLLNKYGAALVLAVVRYARQHNLGVGWIITELRDNRMSLAPEDLTSEPADWKPEIPEILEDDSEQDRNESDALADTEPDGYANEPESAEAKIWASAHAQLVLQLGQPTATCLQAVTFSHTHDGVWVMRCPQPAQAMLQHRLYREIRRVVRDVRGEMVELRFESEVQA